MAAVKNGCIVFLWQGFICWRWNVHPTTDGQFAVFHDWTLDCRTDGHGITREHSIADLKKLDIGYGYTTDGGRRYPFRGSGVGMMPTGPS
jgi:glycerophosphoryl diester phosphodiesterase